MFHAATPGGGLIPDFLVLGHVTVDLLGSRQRLGGTAAYASLTAKRQGLRVGLVTSAGSELDFQEALPGIALEVVPSPRSTTFRNLYTDQARIQYITQIAKPIFPSAIPQHWRKAPLVLLGPVVHELDEAFPNLFPGAFIGLSPQGWLRRWDKSGRVYPRKWEHASEIVPRTGVTVVSEEDLVGEAADLLPVLENAPLAIITCGVKGATLYQEGRIGNLPPRETQVVDPTGAGDVFAAAFMVKYYETGHPVVSAQYAQVAASLSIEAAGTLGIPDRLKIEEWLVAHASYLSPG